MGKRLEPPKDFQDAFKKVFGVPCTPSVLIQAMREADPRLEQVRTIVLHRRQFRVVKED
jgi:hypothetical protein